MNGLLVPPHDPAALAEALEALISSPERRRTMGARGREIAASVFSDDQVIRGTLRVYASLLSTPSPGTA